MVEVVPESLAPSVKFQSLRPSILAMLGLLVFAHPTGIVAAPPPDHPSFAGSWVLNRDLSELSDTVGFNLGMPGPLSSTGGDVKGRSGGRGNRTGPMATAPTVLEGENDFDRTRKMVDEVRHPWPSLTITQDDKAIVVTDAQGRTRTFHTDGKEDSQPLEKNEVATKAKWDSTGFVVEYDVFKGQRIRYTYSRKANPSQLVVLVQFIESGNHDQVKYVYDSGPAAAPPA